MSRYLYGLQELVAQARTSGIQRANACWLACPARTAYTVTSKCATERSCSSAPSAERIDEGMAGDALDPAAGRAVGPRPRGRLYLTTHPRGGIREIGSP
ncbi:hypothetical protein GUJ93_ZPchr0006g42908 [Zizania palustris]|uniref:Uncharacterized protein n=1 Tax=Zizania palustris TaxID=103762 RepID=A0A8J5SHE6_ZIZPA|nr:hypothetical protein GUJ93_ZPchr0006g42908 [Zizania palustris]